MVEKTKIVNADIYRSSAVVKRRGTLTLEAGRNTVFIAGLTVSSLTDTMRLKFVGNVKALDINYISALDVDDDQRPETTDIEKKIENIDKELEICDKIKELREKNADFTSRSDVSVEAQEKVISELPKQLMDLHAKTVELNDTRKKMEEELSRLQAVRNETVIKAELQAETAGTYEFELQYVERKASWTPLYEIRYISEKQPLEVIMKATIRQGTREDWEKVRVTLFTGNPTVSNTIPVLVPSTLSVYEPTPPKPMAAGRGKMKLNAVADGCATFCEEADADMGSADALFSEAIMDNAVVSNEETMTSYELPGTRDIIHNSEGNSAELQRFDVKSVYGWLTVPRLDTRCFMVARIKNTDWPLPAATAKIYIRDAYAGQVYVSTDPEKEEFELSLGVDERISVSRKVSPDKVSGAFLKGTKTRKSEYIIRLSNSASEPLTVTVKDSIPVSTDKSITVETDDISDGKLEEKEGFLVWEREVSSAKPTEIRVAYSISWPKDKILEEN
ncbi:MAG: mucoidy inhibitor MuiA family protein [Lachnospiraceae bacterium]|nr:mucoidy inhibitor MuiA family protein [Lachnospiraceae bacterium]